LPGVDSANNENDDNDNKARPPRVRVRRDDEQTAVLRGRLCGQMRRRSRSRRRQQDATPAAPPTGAREDEKRWTCQRHT
jgi:hypothetical protein